MKQNIELHSIGDRIPKGILTEVDSLFEKVVNFVWEDKVVSVGNPPIPAGPYQIIVHGIAPKDIKTMEITAEHFIINKSFKLIIEPEHMYHSSLDMTELDAELIKSNLSFIRTHWLQQLPDNSLVFLMRPYSRIKTDSDFTRAYMYLMKESYAKLRTDPIAENILAFHGFGFGLTPSGDDFICGYMMGLRILHELGKNELSKLLDIIYSGLLRKSTNRLVNLFALTAYESLYSEHWKYFLAAFLGSKISHTDQLLKPILAFGETSGADTLIGLISALEFKF